MSGTTVYWTNWTSDATGATTGVAAGAIVTPSGTISVGYAGEVTSETVVNGTSTTGYPSWGPASTYADGAVVPDAPTFHDLIAQNGGDGTGVNTITFSTPITNPVMAIWSLGSGSDDANYTFTSREPYTIIAGGPSNEYGGGGLVPNNGSVYSVTGSEANGTIQFIGTYTQLTFTADVFENYYGFTLGVEGSAASPTVDTIAGAGLTLSLDFGIAGLATIVSPLLANVTAANGLFITVAGAYSMAAGQSAAIDAAPGAVSVAGGGGGDETIVAGAGPFNFDAGQGGSGTVAAGGGADLLNLSGGGNWLAALGDGADTINAASGNDTVSTGDGGSIVFLGAGADSVASAGADTIVGSTGAATVNAVSTPLYFGASGATLFNALGASATLAGGGAETVNAGASNMLVFGGAAGGVDFFAGGGSSTVVTYAGGGTINGGSGNSLYFGIGPFVYNAGSGVDTVVGYGGDFSATGGANGTLFFTGSAGGNVLSTGSGASTIIGFGAGDVYNATGGGDGIIEAAGASSTIDGSQSTGSNSFFAFANNDVVIGGSGPTAIESAFGDQTLIAGGGSTLFELLDSGSPHAITIGNFVAGQDFVQLQGYGAGAGAAALQTATSLGGSQVLTLPDGTTVTFQGTTGLTASAFV